MEGRGAAPADPSPAVLLACAGGGLVDPPVFAELAHGEKAVVGGDHDAVDASMQQLRDRGVEHVERRVEGPPARGELVRLAVGVDLGGADEH